MCKPLLYVPVLLWGIALSAAHPVSINSMSTNGVPDTLSFKSLDSPPVVNHGITQDYINLLDADQWKELLAQGKVRDMIDIIQRALGSDRPVRVRTQWGGSDPKDIGNTVHNTINWNAYQGDKTNLNLVMDSKFSRRNGKVDVVDPNFGLNFQLKY